MTTVTALTSCSIMEPSARFGTWFVKLFWMLLSSIVPTFPWSASPSHYSSAFGIALYGPGEEQISPTMDHHCLATFGYGEQRFSVGDRLAVLRIRRLKPIGLEFSPM